jgi:iodotyrosine deiodinase
MEAYKHIALIFPRIPADEQLRASRDFLSRMSGRRSVLLFSPEPVPLELIENAIRRTSLAPSGANQQPRKFVVVQNADFKRKIREAAESRRARALPTPDAGRRPNGWRRWLRWVRTGTRSFLKWRLI